MKKKYSRILGVALALMLLASLFGFATPVSAANVAWSTIANPSALSIAMNRADFEVGPIAVSPDGNTLFAAIVAETALAGVAGAGQSALVQSSNGYTWTATGLINQPAPITGIAVSSNFAADGTMCVASGATVFRSINQGETFIALKPILDSGAIPITAINSIAMWAGTPAYVMVGTDRDVLVLRDSVFEDWRDQELGNPLPAVAVAFAPDFATSNYIWAVTAAGVVSATNSPGAWGTLYANTAVLSAAVSASIAFPDNYGSTTAPYLWVGIDSGANTGGVWRVRGLPFPGPSQAVKQYGVAPTPAALWDVRSLAASGTMASATILAGLQNSPTVVKSVNGGITWPPQVFKQPTGGGAVFVAMAPDFATSNVAYLGTADGFTAESAFQMTSDGGMSWSQTGLIDTPFTAINDIAVVSQDDIFVVSDNFSLWKIADASSRFRTWERILTPATATIPGNVLANIARVSISPDFLTDGVVYVTDNATGVMKAIDGGTIFAPMGAPAGNITAVHVLDATFAYIGSVGQVYRTDDGGYSWLAAITPPGGTVTSIAVTPNYDTSATMMVGCTGMGNVFMSDDRGVTFSRWAGAPPMGLGPGAKYVAFDPGWTGSGQPGTANRGVYAAAGNTIQRYYTPGVGWENIHVGPPPAINQLLTSPDGTLYGSNALAGVGVERSLNPTASPPSDLLTGPVEGVLAPVWESVNTQLAGTATLMGLWLIVDETLTVSGSKNVLYSIDTTNATVVTYTDTLATQVVPISPEDGAIFARMTGVSLEWEELTGALGYHWQIARDDAFRLMQDQGFSTYPTDISNLLAAGQTYFWRVRVDGPGAPPIMGGPPGLPVLSRWSEAATFTTELGARIWHPFTNMGGVAPGPGAQNILTKPTFQWNGADWATSYELLLAGNPDFTGATAKTLTTTSWVSDTDLGYSTTYYWKVRALSGISQSEWSDVGIFTTMAEPAPPIVIEEVPDIIVEVPPAEVPPAVEVTPVAPAYLLAIIIIGAILVIFVIVLIVRTRRPI